MLVTKISLQQLLDNASPAKRGEIIGRALVVLFERQTEAERVVNDTREDNNIGFASCDAKSGSLSAKSFLKYRRLLDWQIERWYQKNDKGFSRIVKYHKQLNDAAVAKAARQQQSALPLE